MSTTLQGKILVPQNTAELRDAVLQAFDYRGDVTLHFKDGSEVTGYVYSHNLDRDEVLMFVEIEPKNSISKRFAISDISNISFTGEDCAFGKEYQAKKARS